MTQPARWGDDPGCGHEVACAYQTHYCTYIRVPRLLTLQTPGAPDDLLLITALQWYELWFKVLLTDLRAVVGDDGHSFEPVKLLRRGIELLRLFQLQADLTEMIIARELRLSQPVSDFIDLSTSDQLAQLIALERELPRLARRRSSGMVFGETVREYSAHFKIFRTRFQKFLKATLRPQSQAPTYAAWLRLPELLALQNGVKGAWAEVGRQPEALMEAEHISADENMFIIVHQCFEVWFRVILDHIDRSFPALQQDDIAQATRLLRRVLLIQRLLASQIHIPGTMQPLDFLRFRDQRCEHDGKMCYTGLSPASGTESYQFREIEIACGLGRDPIFQKYLAGTDKLPIRLLTPRQRERLEQMALPEAFQNAVRARGLPNADALFKPANARNPNADLAELADILVDFDDFFRFWRLSHVSMVQKMIGTKSGTGFLGPEYLMETVGLQIQEHNRIFEERQVRPRFFEELWATRSRLKAE